MIDIMFHLVSRPPTTVHGSRQVLDIVQNVLSNIGRSARVCATRALLDRKYYKFKFIKLIIDMSVVFY